ncbi:MULTISPECIES: DctP family TRAP transporter solute-binding subunit [unclassified Janibacter]|uniref:DctP family TRAP transporter solute-binding subunit n=1 Tax=unclassified Janibacter TaxID=2649294 RepID=UPI003D05B9C8
MSTNRTRANLVVGLAALTSLTLAACGGARSGDSGGGEDKTYTLKFSHVTTDNTPKGKAANEFAKLVEEESEGKIKVEVFPNSELYGDKDEMQALQSNSVQMLAPASAKFTTIAPELQVLDLPFLFDDVQDIPEVVTQDSKVGEAIYNNKKLAENGVKVLGLWDNGLKQFSSNKGMVKPADVKGLSFRIQPSDVLRSQFQAWGAKATPMAFSEVYSAMQQGVIDGGENTYSNIASQKMHTVQKHISEINNGYIGYVLVVNQKWFDELPKDLQEVVTEAADAATELNREVAAQVNADAKAEIEKAGTTEITVLSDEERQAFKDAVVPKVWKQYEDVLGKDVVEELLSKQN